MTKLELEAIRKRAESATEGPWTIGGGKFGESRIITADWRIGISDEVYERVDAEFIAHARADIPKLLAEVERLNAKVDKLTGVIYDHGCEINLESSDDFIEKLADELRNHPLEKRGSIGLMGWLDV